MYGWSSEPLASASGSFCNATTHLGQSDIWERSSLLEKLSCDGSISNKKVLEDTAVWCVCHFVCVCV